MTVPAAEVTGKVTAAGGQALPGALVRVVSIVPSTAALPPRPAPVLTIRAGRLEPLTLVVLTNEPFTLTNMSEVPYNVHFRFKASIERNFGMAGPPVNRTTVLVPKAELFARIWEDLSRLNGHVCVVENPFYALTDASGAFKLPDLPPGAYTMEAAHPRTGSVQREIIITGANTSLNFELPLKRANPL
jgi:hypothetical protein